MYVSLLKGINVGGNKKVPMKELQDMYEKLGLNQVKTYIQSGNVVFEAADKKPEDLQTQLETAIQQHFGFQVSVLVRSKEEWGKIVQQNTLLNSHYPLTCFHLTLLQTNPLPQKTTEILQNLPQNLPDKTLIWERNIYLFCPDGYGKTLLHNQYWEKQFRATATTRNWRTVLTLLEMIQ